MVSSRQQRLVTWGLVVVAFGALLLGIRYQGDRLDDDAAPIIDTPSDSSGSSSGGTTTSTGPAPAVNPIEGFLPRSGEGSACREPVGVDLVSGYGATLTINGIAIAPEDMNVNIGADGEITDEITASRSLSQYTYGPEADCPNGRVLRPTDNVMQACVYRVEEGPARCTVTEYVFDVL